ncbi:MAG: DUF3857 domain-containing protein [Saprospiraceae bacterium]|nr:DUF3857 domain-containing protein [Saprospiraceae bacterium]
MELTTYFTSSKKIRLTLLVLICSLAGFNVFAQPAKIITFGNVPAVDLEMRIYEPDTSAGAVILEDMGTLMIEYKKNFVTKLQRHTRIKVLKESGTVYGDLLIPFTHGEKLETITDLKVMVHHPDGRKQSISKKSFVTEKLDEQYSVIKVPCPGVQVGSIIEYAYDLRSKNFLMPREWYFQSDIPTRYSCFRMLETDDFRYTFILIGNEEVKDDSINFQAFDLPALTQEVFVTWPESYCTRLTLQLNAIRSGFFMQPVLNTWEDLAQGLKVLPYFGVAINETNVNAKAWEELEQKLSGIDDERLKAKIIYDHVVSKVEWNGLYTIYTGKSKNEVWNSGTGTTADINALIINLMLRAGLQAHPVLGCPRNLGWFNDRMPVMDNIKYFFGEVMANGERILFNGINKGVPFGYLPENDYNGKAVLLNKDTAQVIDIPAQYSTDYHVILLDIKEEGLVDVNISSIYHGVALEFRTELQKEEKQKEYLMQLLDAYQNVEILEYTSAKKDSIFEENIHLTFDLNATNEQEFIYLQQSLMSSFIKNPFVARTRKYPMDFAYLAEENIHLIINIPEGYQLESLPASKSIQSEKGEIAFNVEYQLNEKVLDIEKSASVNSAFIFPSRYDDIKYTFAEIERLNNDILVLKKVE